MSDFYNKYPYTDFHELNLDWVIERVKKLTEDWIETKQAWENTEADWQELYDYVHDYFDNLNVQTEINNKIDAMILDGTFQQIATPIIQAKVAADLPEVVSDQIGGAVALQIDGAVSDQIGSTVAAQIGNAVVNPVNAWLSEHITQPTTPAIDNTLTIGGAGADAEKTGLMTSVTYSSLKKYNIGDLVNYNGSLYRCISTISTPEAWTAAHWKITQSGAEITIIKKDVSHVNLIDNGTLSASDNCTITFENDVITVKAAATWGWLHGDILMDCSASTDYYIELLPVKSVAANQTVQIVYLAGTTTLETIGYTKPCKITTPATCDHIKIAIWASRGDPATIGDNVVITNPLISVERDTVHNIDNMLHHKYIFIGDSYGVGYNPDELTEIGWPRRVANILGLTVDSDVFISCESGYGFANENGQFITLLNNAFSSIHNPLEITDILVCGGVNDATVVSTDDCRAAIAAFCTQAAALFPNALVHVGCIGRSKTLAIKNDMPRVIGNYQTAANQKNGSYIANCEYILCDQSHFSSDGTHPARSGYVTISKHLANYIKNKNIDVIYGPRTIGMLHGNAEYQLQNNLTTLYYNANFAPDSSTMTSGTSYYLAYSNTVPFNGYGEWIYDRGHVMIHQNIGGVDTQTRRPIRIRFTNSAFEYQIETDDGATETFNDVYQIDIRLGYMLFPSLQM